MSHKRPLAERCAETVKSCLLCIDTRLLVALVSVAGLLAWLMPWQVTAGFFVLACIIAATAYTLSREGRTALLAYSFFVLMWGVSQFVLYLFEYPGHFREALYIAVYLAARLFTLLGLALAVPLTVTPLTLGRTLTWYLGWLVGAEKFVCEKLFRGKVRRVFAGGVWRAALALCLMMAFFPRSMRAMSGLRRSLAMRAPRLSLRKRVAFMGLALLRVLSAQTWDMTLAIASRNVYRPEPWEWREKE